MKILLINPPRSNENKILEYASCDTKKFVHKKLIGPPLGLLTIATAIKNFHDVTFIDLKGEYDLNPNSPSLTVLINRYLKKINPDIVGVTFIASEFYSGIEIFKTVKEYNQKILTVAGGLHATLCPDDFNNKYVDVICPGYAVDSFKEVIRAKEKNTKLEEVNGIILRKKNKFISTEPIKNKCNPAGKDYIIPDRSFLDRWLSTYKVGKHPTPATYLYTSLGCPNKCSFCSIWPQYQGNFYQRSINSIITELVSINDYDLVRFSDANTIVDVNFIEKLFDEIIHMRIKKHYVMDIRFDTVVNNPKLIEKLARGGLKVVICGFESFREEELKEYNKEANPQLIKKAINILHKNGIMVRGNYIVPNYYDEDDFKALAEYANKHKVVFAGYTILTPMPGTVFYKKIKDEIIDFNLSRYNFFNCVLKTRLTPEKFYENMSNLWLIKKGLEIV